MLCYGNLKIIMVTLDNCFFSLTHFWILATNKLASVTSCITCHQEIPQTCGHRTSNNSLRLENSNDQREPERLCQNAPKRSHEMDSENLKHFSWQHLHTELTSALYHFQTFITALLLSSHV
jgi:hypothetical protein